MLRCRVKQTNTIWVGRHDVRPSAVSSTSHALLRCHRHTCIMWRATCLSPHHTARKLLYRTHPREPQHDKFHRDTSALPWHHMVHGFVVTPCTCDHTVCDQVLYGSDLDTGAVGSGFPWTLPASAGRGHCPEKVQPWSSRSTRNSPSVTHHLQLPLGQEVFLVATTLVHSGGLCAAALHVSRTDK